MPPLDPLVPCEKHELPNCGACKPKPEPVAAFRRKPLFRKGGDEAVSFTAQYDGLCAACGEDIDAGVDLIKRDEDLDDWVHTRCWRESF